MVELPVSLAATRLSRSSTPAAFPQGTDGGHWKTLSGLEVMIVCVSANPAIDRRIRLQNLRRGAVNRVRSATGAGGGKAAHVALALRALGMESILVGFFGGATGREC